MRFQVDVLTSGNVRLNDILFDDITLFYFMEVRFHGSVLQETKQKSAGLAFSNYLPKVGLQNSKKNLKSNI